MTKTTTTDLFVSELTRSLKAVAMTEFLTGNLTGHASMKAAAKVVGQFYSEWIRRNGTTHGSEIRSSEIVDAFDIADRDAAQMVKAGVLDASSAHTTLCLVSNAMGHVDLDLMSQLIPEQSKEFMPERPDGGTRENTNTSTNGRLAAPIAKKELEVIS